MQGSASCAGCAACCARSIGDRLEVRLQQLVPIGLLSAEEARKSAHRRRLRCSCALARREIVELGGHDEVVLVQALDLLGLQRDRSISPTEAQLRVVALGLGELARSLDE